MIFLNFHNIDELVTLHYEAVKSYVENTMRESSKANFHSRVLALSGMEDVSDSDISDVNIEKIIMEVANNYNESEEKEKNENEDDEDINKAFIEELNKKKNSKEVKEFYYKEKLKIDINTDLGKKEREKLFNIYLEGLQWILCY